MHIKFPLPRFIERDAIRIAEQFYAISGSAEPLPSERDQNFLLTSDSGSFVLKISNVLEERDTLDLQNSTLTHLAATAAELRLPHVCKTTTGEEIITVESSQGVHFVRLLTYVPARIFARVKPHTPALLQSLGKVIASIDRALQDFRHPSARRELKWDLTRASWIREYLPYIEDAERRAIVEGFLAEFETNVLAILRALPSTLIYNDANDHNILVHPNDAEVIGVIDFGDMVSAPRICDLAIAIAYAALYKPDALSAACHVITGYHEQSPLDDRELQVLFPLVCMRICVSVVNSAYQRKVEPDNPYLMLTEKGAWALLETLSRFDPALAQTRMRHACGVLARSREIVQWLRSNRDQIGRLLEADLKQEATLIDLNVGSGEFGTLGDMCDTRTLTTRIFARIAEAGKRIGIGRYNEARVLSTSDAFRFDGNDGPELRSVHLGVDLFAEPGTSVFAPMDGIVHSFRDNQPPPDYGPTLVLQHIVDDGRVTFFTLYGHLSAASLTDLYEGKKIAKGSILGRIGRPDENGGWPPHVHFQIVCDMFGMKGDFPGNAAPSQRDFWLELCPDPNLVIAMPELTKASETISNEHLLALRSQYVSRSLSITYSKPLHLVRGWMQYMYDADGRAYLDAVNNVAHVGHCHPKVVRAAQQQIALLNTNTRYLHENLVRYAERLTALLPESLSVCFFVNSGSEANELAIRLARTHTGQNDMIVLEGGYHGNTSTLVELSSYKFDGPFGTGPAPHVQKVLLADPYRGIYKRTDLKAGEEYAAFVGEAIDKIRKGGKVVCGFLHESMPSSAGQIVFPEDYLREAYRLVREAGGVCIADEVQTGFGRLGSYFWGFQTQDVIPDIVTLGKPIGNGHPLGAVITTREIAESFSNGMEFFSTFGGNPVSSAIGLAVLDVIAEEQLQQNAKNVGDYLLQGLQVLHEKHPLIGDVRGMGLYIGIELVADRQTLAPAASNASYVVNRMKDRGVLLSTDGILENVLKIRPPLVFNTANADFLIANLDVVLQEAILL